MNFECSALSCPSMIYCSNRHFQLFQDRLVYPIKTKFKGWGLAAGEFIPKNSFVMQYVGEVFSVDSDIGRKRIKRYKGSTCTYLMRIENNEVIDPTYSGNIARFINHSCDPNCQTRKWTILNEICVGIFTLKDIRENEELTFDYQFDFFKTAFTRCYCGAAGCKGYLGVARKTREGTSSSDSSPIRSGESLNDSADSRMDGDASSSSRSAGGKSDQAMGEASDGSLSEHEEIRLRREEAIIASAVNQDCPTCFLCKKNILDTKRILICKGPCKEMFHYDCAVKQDKSLAGNKKIRTQRKFECKPCYRKASG